MSMDIDIVTVQPLPGIGLAGYGFKQTQTLESPSDNLSETQVLRRRSPPIPNTPNALKETPMSDTTTPTVQELRQAVEKAKLALEEAEERLRMATVVAFVGIFCPDKNVGLVMCISSEMPTEGTYFTGEWLPDGEEVAISWDPELMAQHLELYEQVEWLEDTSSLLYAHPEREGVERWLERKRAKAAR